MKKRIAIAVVAVSVGASASVALAAPKSFSVVAVRTSTGKATATASSFTENLLTGKKVVGHDSIKCKVSGGKTTCMGVFTFKAGGTIAIDSPLTAQGNDAAFKISGGTGQYAGSAGILKLAPISGTQTKLTFTLS
jgi:hypothetical protein